MAVIGETTEVVMIKRLNDSVVSVIRVAITRLYHLPIAELKFAEPSLDEIIRLCSLFNKIVEGTDIDGQFIEAIGVMKEAAEAAKRDDEKCLIDCAYHLEDFLSRMKP